MSKKKHIHELPEDRPATMDEGGKHVKMHPLAVRGFFRDNRDRVYAGLIFIFLVMPWLQWNGKQLLLFDIPNRRFSIFGMDFWAHDTPMVFFVFAVLGMGLTFMTLNWGRVWCGWACPQTVFIDFIFRKIEIWVEGTHVHRIKLDAAKWSPEKIRKKTIKWFLFFMASFVIAHSFLAYFVGAKEVLVMMQTLPTENWTSFLIVFFITAAVLFNFGWFREQFCAIMCPYGRFQSVLMDENSLAIVYDEKRGEPRKGTVEKGQEGDCISCYKCVAACPTGIDIRRGVQMECIACTACIDACDEVMERMKKPKGLIRYESVNGLLKKKVSKFQVKPLLALTAMIVAAIGLTYSVASRKQLDANFFRASESPYTQKQVDDKVLVTNHFKVHLKNQIFDPIKVSLHLLNGEELDVDLVAPTFPLNLEAGKSFMAHIFLKFPKSVTIENGVKNIQIILNVESKGKVETFNREITLVGPLT